MGREEERQSISLEWPDRNCQQKRPAWLAQALASFSCLVFDSATSQRMKKNTHVMRSAQKITEKEAEDQRASGQVVGRGDEGSTTVPKMRNPGKNTRQGFIEPNLHPMASSLIFLTSSLTNWQ